MFDGEEYTFREKDKDIANNTGGVRRRIWEWLGMGYEEQKILPALYKSNTQCGRLMKETRITQFGRIGVPKERERGDLEL